MRRLILALQGFFSHTWLSLVALLASALAAGVVYPWAGAAWGILVLAVGAWLALWLLAAGAFEQLRRFHRQQMAEVYGTVKMSIVNQQAAVTLSRRFPNLWLPPSAYSMQPANLTGVLDLLERGQPGLVVELGCGGSTLLIASYLREVGKGRLVSFDHDAGWADITRYYLARHGLTEWVDLRICPLRDRDCGGQRLRWYDLDAAVDDLRDIDVLVIDGPPAGDNNMNRLPAMEVFHPRLSARAAVFLDDGERAGERRVAAQWARQFPDLQSMYMTTFTGYWLLSKKSAGALAAQAD